MNILQFFERYLQGNGWQVRVLNSSPSAKIHLIAQQTDDPIGIRLIDAADVKITPDFVRETLNSADAAGCTYAAVIAKQEIPRDARREAERLGSRIVLIGVNEISRASRLLEQVLSSGVLAATGPARKPPPIAKPRRPFKFSFWKFAAALFVILVLVLVGAARLRNQQVAETNRLQLGEAPPQPIAEATPGSLLPPPETSSSESAPVFDPAAGGRALTPDESAALRQRLASIQIGVLPKAESYAYAWLTKQSAKIAPISWEELAAGPPDTNTTPILLYATTEYYGQTIRSPRDVDLALYKYLSSGGFLVILPSMPYPFYYNEKGEAVIELPSGHVINTNKGLGVRFSQFTWETPPAGVDLRFHTERTAFPHVTGLLPFPNEGDLRWRSISPTAESQTNAQYRTLVRLVDAAGYWRGDAAGYVESPNGRLLYGWFRLLDSPQRDAYLHDLFTFIVEKLGK
jgi:hypothetical protein